jgi:hypothetical protein
MNNYIEAVCIGRPLDLPSYDEDSELWEVYFEESPTPWNPYSERDIIGVPMESSEEACEVYNHYNQNPATEGIEEDEETTN